MNGAGTPDLPDPYIVLGRNREGGYDTVHIDDLPGLDKARARIENDLAGIEQQLIEAKGNAQSGLGYSDPKWYAKLIGAKKFKGSAHQRILRRIKELKHKEREALENTRDRIFIKICSRRLDSELFKSLWQEVEDEITRQKANV